MDAEAVQQCSNPTVKLFSMMKHYISAKLLKSHQFKGNVSLPYLDHI